MEFFNVEEESGDISIAARESGFIGVTWYP